MIRRTIKFPETTVAGEPITTYAPTSPGADRLPDAGQGGARPMPRRVGLPGAAELFRDDHRALSACRRPEPATDAVRSRSQRAGPARREDHRLRQQRRAARPRAGPADAAGAARRRRRPRTDRARRDRLGDGRPRRPRRRTPDLVRGLVPAVTPSVRRPSEFTVRLTNFEGPFDLLLQLISRHKLDVTEVALSQVTDEFIAHIKHAQATTAPAVGPGPDQLVPRRRGHPARPQGRPAAAPGRGRRRRGPGAAGGPRPAVRPAAAVPGVQAGQRLDRCRPLDEPGPAPPASRRAGGALRRAAARGRAGRLRRRARRARRPGAGAPEAPAGVAGPPARPAGQRPRAGRT